MKEIIERLEAARIEKGLSHEQVGTLAGIGKGNVWKILKQQAEPAAGTLFKIAEALGFEIVMNEAKAQLNTNWKDADVVLPENGKAGKVVVTKARQTGKSSKLKDIAKIDLVEKAKAVPLLKGMPITYNCGCKMENNLFMRKKGCKLSKENH